MSDDEESLPKNTSAARESSGKAGAHRALPLTGHATPLHPAAEEGRGGDHRGPPTGHAHVDNPPLAVEEVGVGGGGAHR